jgi:hypothetical protein
MDSSLLECHQTRYSQPPVMSKVHLSHCRPSFLSLLVKFGETRYLKSKRMLLLDKLHTQAISAGLSGGGGGGAAAPANHCPGAENRIGSSILSAVDPQVLISTRSLQSSRAQGRTGTRPLGARKPGEAWPSQLCVLCELYGGSRRWVGRDPWEGHNDNDFLGRQRMMFLWHVR